MSDEPMLHRESVMARVDDFLNLVDDPSRRSLGAEDPSDRALLELMVHVAFSDGVVAPKEMDFLQKVLNLF